jgi:hypothetical protein
LNEKLGVGGCVGNRSDVGLDVNEPLSPGEARCGCLLAPNPEFAVDVLTGVLVPFDGDMDLSLGAGVPPRDPFRPPPPPLSMSCRHERIRSDDMGVPLVLCEMDPGRE